jgi:dTDP-4-amino-4,6-dideoxygalactose transaminase
VYPRHRLDLKPRDLAYAAAVCVWAHDPDRLAGEIERDASGERLVCFSVRSAFELLLDALDFEPGSEILMSAITHPDMARIVERHGLVAVPVDLDLETLQPRAELLERAATPRTRMLVVAHLFGARVDLDAAVALCRRLDLLLVEDCAQTLRSPEDSGDPRSDVALFSFGSIKTAPALGGAVACVRDPALLERMRRIQRPWPRQARGEYAKRVSRFLGLLTLGHPLMYEGFVRGGRRFGVDVDALVNRSVHALKPPPAEQRDEFGEWVRRRPSAPLLALLRRRLRRFDRARLRQRGERGERAAQALPSGIFHPGRAASERTHWVFPVACRDPKRAIEKLREAGFDATAATSSIAAMAPPPDRPELEPNDSIDFMEQVVFVPVYPEIPERAFRRLLEALARLEDERLGEIRAVDEPGEPVRS